MFAEERRQQIVALVNERNRVTVEELCEELNVSPATVRKDLTDLDERGFLHRTHGGAIGTVQVEYESNTKEKTEQFLEEKKLIAEEALKYIHEGDCIALDSGTTTFELAKLLVKFKNLRIITNDLMIANYIDQNTDFQLFVVGGMVRNEHHYMMGHIMTEVLEKLNTDVFFVSSNGVDLDSGLTTPQLETALYKSVVLKNSRSNILLVDHTKFGKVLFSRFARLKDMDHIITDAGLDSQEVKKMKKAGIRVTLVDGTK